MMCCKVYVILEHNYYIDFPSVVLLTFLPAMLITVSGTETAGLLDFPQVDTLHCMLTY